MDIMTLLSVLFAFICIIVGYLLENGNILALLQPTAALIVIGGTLGAVGISFPSKLFKKFLKVFSITVFLGWCTSSSANNWTEQV